MQKKRDIGVKGEKVAAEYLKKRGFSVLEQNYKDKRAEIDIIAQKGGVLVFVEVRSTASTFFGTPEETVSAQKKRKMRKNALAYTAFKNYRGDYRIDLVCVVFQGNSVKEISYYENITL